MDFDTRFGGGSLGVAKLQIEFTRTSAYWMPNKRKRSSEIVPSGAPLLFSFAFNCLRQHPSEVLNS